MDLEEIQSLIKFVAKSGATEVELETGDFKITIKTPNKKKNGEPDTIIQQVPVGIPPIAVAPAPITPAAPAAAGLRPTKLSLAVYTKGARLLHRVRKPDGCQS